MAKPIFRAVALALLFALAACSNPGYNIPAQIGSFNGSLEELAEEAILINILRASEGAPLGFTAVAQVIGTGSAQASFGLPSIGSAGPGPIPLLNRPVIGPNGVVVAPGVNVSVLPLETKEFWLGMLTPLSANTLAFFINQGVPRETLFYLYIQRVELSSTGKPTEVEINDPNDPGFGQFSDDVRVALSLGLTAKLVSRTFNVGPPLPQSEAANVKNLLEVAKAGLNIVPAQSTSGPATYQLQGTGSAAVLCFDQARATVDISSRLPREVNCAGSEAPPPAKEGSPFAYQESQAAQAPLNIAIFPRSTYDIFRFLGSIVRKSMQNNGRNVSLVTNEAKQFAGGTGLADQLFVVQKNVGGPAFVRVKYGSNWYSIPKSATTTIAVLSLLREMIALSTSVNSLPSAGGLTTIVK